MNTDASENTWEPLCAPDSRVREVPQVAGQTARQFVLEDSARSVIEGRNFQLDKISSPFLSAYCRGQLSKLHASGVVGDKLQ
jgi:hypothetical protein